jgi:hypothetical protein
MCYPFPARAAAHGGPTLSDVIDQRFERFDDRLGRLEEDVKEIKGDLKAFRQQVTGDFTALRQQVAGDFTAFRQ